MEADLFGRSAPCLESGSHKASPGLTDTFY